MHAVTQTVIYSRQQNTLVGKDSGLVNTCDRSSSCDLPKHRAYCLETQTGYPGLTSFYSQTMLRLQSIQSEAVVCRVLSAPESGLFRLRITVCLAPYAGLSSPSSCSYLSVNLRPLSICLYPSVHFRPKSIQPYPSTLLPDLPDLTPSPSIAASDPLPSDPDPSPCHLAILADCLAPNPDPSSFTPLQFLSCPFFTLHLPSR